MRFELICTAVAGLAILSCGNSYPGLSISPPVSEPATLQVQPVEAGVFNSNPQMTEYTLQAQ